jgi:hypothetical protein
MTISPEIPKWVAPPTAPNVRENMFPARVHDAATGDELLDAARVVVGTDRIWVFASAPQGVVCVLSQPIYEIAGDKWDGVAITLAQADSAEPGNTLIVTINRGHCGCGSKLKGFRPFKSSGLLSTSS